MATDIHQELDKLKTDIEALRKDVASMAQSVKELGVQKGQEALTRAEELGERARSRARYAEERFSDEIGERPFVSLLAAFGLGFIVAKLFDADD
jgi:ElaB/YqjD/DUF883 family membrane-anchored ribosome-binding protein